MNETGLARKLGVHSGARLRRGGGRGARSRPSYAGTWSRSDQVALSALDGDLPMNAALSRAFEARGMSVAREALSAAPYVRLPATWEAYLGVPVALRSLHDRRSLRAFEKWAGADTEFVRVSSASDLEEGKRILIRLHEQRWRAAGKSGVFSSRLFRSFHDAVLPHLIAKNALELVWLTARGAPVAVAYNFVWDNRVLFYQGGRAMDLPKKVRPGIVLHAHGIRKAIEAGRSEYDFMSGARPYKVQMSTDSRPVTRLVATKAPMRDLVCEMVGQRNHSSPEQARPHPATRAPRATRSGAARSARPGEDEGDQRQPAVRDPGGAQQRAVADERVGQPLRREELAASARRDPRGTGSRCPSGARRCGTPSSSAGTLLLEDVAGELGEELSTLCVVRAQLGSVTCQFSDGRLPGAIASPRVLERRLLAEDAAPSSSRRGTRAWS